MLVTLEHFGDQYKRIKQQAAAAGGGCSVLILVAPDCDALCAARILTTLLRADDVEFKMVAVAGYTDVQTEVNEALAADGNGSSSGYLSSPLRSVILINCGAVPKIDELLELPPPPSKGGPSITLYIMDSHRPIYHTNINEPKESAGRIRVLVPQEKHEFFSSADVGGSGMLQEDVIPMPGDSEAEDAENEESTDEEEDDDDEVEAEELDEDPDDEEDEDGEGEEEDPSAPGSGKKRKRKQPKEAKKKRRLRKAADKSDSDDDDDDDDGDRKRKRRRRGSDSDSSDNSDAEDGQETLAQMVRKLQKQKAARYRQYTSQGHHYAHPASYTALMFVQEANRAGKPRNDMVWLAIVGLTDLYLKEALDTPSYRLMYRVLNKLVEENNGEDKNPFRHSLASGAGVASGAGNAASTGARDAFAALGGASNGGVGAGLTGDEDTTGKGSAGVRGFISASLEPRFVSHRFWNLYDSMYFSEYCAAKLETWRGDSGGGSTSTSAADKSKSKLDSLLALTGVKLETIKQPWVSLPQEQKDTIMRRLQAFCVCANFESGQVSVDDVGWDCSFLPLPEPETARMVLEKFELTPAMFYESFAYSVDMEPEISAADAVNAINGLLCSGQAAPALLEHVKDTLGLDIINAAAGNGAGGAAGGAAGGGAGSAGAGAAGSSATAAIAARERMGASATMQTTGGGAILTAWQANSWKDGFLAAWEAISRRNHDPLLSGIRAHCQMRRALMRLSNAVVRNKQFTSGKLVRQLVIDNDVMNDYDSRTFTQPIALAALGRYLIKLYRDSLMSWRSTKTGKVVEKPLILFVSYPFIAVGRRWLTAHGLPVTEDWGTTSAVSFLDAFQSAAREAGAEYLMDSFDSATMLLDVEHKARFMECLDPST